MISSAMPSSVAVEGVWYVMQGHAHLAEPPNDERLASSTQDLRYFVPLPAGAEAKGKESSVPGKLELLKVRQLICWRSVS